MTKRTARTHVALATLVIAASAGCGTGLTAKGEAPHLTLSPPVVPTTLTTVAVPVTSAAAAATSCFITGTTGTGWTSTTSYKFTANATNTYALLITSFDVSFFTGTSADGSDDETAANVTAGLLKPNSSLSWNVAKSSGGSVGDSCVVESVGVTPPGGIAETLHNSIQP